MSNPVWEIGGRDISGHITSLKCSECGYRIKPDYYLKRCPNCHVDMTNNSWKPHYNIKMEGDWGHYELVAPGKLMKVTVDGHTFLGVTDVWTNDKTKEMRVRLYNDVEHRVSFSSFSITSYEDRKEENNEQPK